MKASEFFLATQNHGKLVEMKMFMQKLSSFFTIRGLDSLPQSIPPPEETGATFIENATIKAIYYSQVCGSETCIIAEDSGLSVDALHGAPGVYSARFASEKASDAQNIDKLLELMKDQSNRQAHFITVIALAQAGKLITTFSGVVHGLISLQRKGQHGFGYDPVFFCPLQNKCFAEMTAVEKNKVSHRAKAMTALGHFLQEMRKLSPAGSQDS